MIRRVVGGSIVATVALLVFAAPQAVAREASQAVMTPVSALKWSESGIPGVQVAAVQGDMARGPSHFYLKYAAGLVTPVHHHSPDHHVTTLSGTLVLVANGKEQRLAPGSYFAFTGKAKHLARCEGDQDCVMFVDARGPWDVVPEAKADATSK